MGTRIGAFKTKNCQLVIWKNDKGISFTFGKHYKDKQTGEWKKTETIYSDELLQLADMFRRAGLWASKQENLEEPLPENTSQLRDVVSGIVSKLSEVK
jgi:hypothetical protein